MPTTRPRHFVTETDELADALNEAGRRWPDVSRAQLIVRLALEGNAAARRAEDQRTVRRLEALERLSGSLPGVYDEGYLERMREEWAG